VRSLEPHTFTCIHRRETKFVESNFSLEMATNSVPRGRAANEAGSSVSIFLPSDVFLSFQLNLASYDVSFSLIYQSL
jgi:hypothetical protein